MIRHIVLKISPNPSFPKRGIPPFRKGREEGFSLQRPYNYGLISNREKQIKKWKRAWKLELIEKHNPQWNDLYESICG